MISNTMQNAINEQIQKEFYSSYLYLAMAANCETLNLPGFARWMYLQAEEERSHGMKLFEHVIDRGGKVELQAIEAPQSVWKDSLELFQNVQEHEAFVTASIHSLYEVALKEKDYAAQVMLQWFIDEQVEEEKNAAEIVEQLRMVDGKGSALLMLDRALGARGKE